jgi:hypothetical protein
MQTPTEQIVWPWYASIIVADPTPLNDEPEDEEL